MIIIVCICQPELRFTANHIAVTVTYDWECLNKAMQPVHASDFWSAILVRRVIFFFLLFHSCPVGATSDGMQTRAATLTSRLSLEYKI